MPESVPRPSWAPRLPGSGRPGLTKGWWRLPALSGLVLGLSYMPGPLLACNFTAFLPLLGWLESHPHAQPRERFRAGFVFGLVTHAIALHWQYSMLAFSWLALLLYVGMVALFALRIALSVLLLGWLRRRTGLGWWLLLPICWLSPEWLQTWGDLRMTGEHLAHSISGYPFIIQFADLVGPYGVGAFLLACNGLIFEAALSLGWRPAGRRAALGLAALLLGVIGYDAWAWNKPEPKTPTLRVALIQPNIPLLVKHDDTTDVDQWSTLERMTLEAAKHEPDLIIWPESARPQPLVHRLDRPETYAMPDVQALAKKANAALLLGVEYVQLRGPADFDWYNAAMAVDRDGVLRKEWGAKVYLVPFVEGIPFEPLLGPLVKRRGGEWQWVSGGFTAGLESALIELAGAKVGVLVCYEQLFYDLPRKLRNRGAELQVVITNDAWFGRSIFQTYQANALRMRAIENRTHFVRVANTGISGFVDGKGRYHERTALFEPALKVMDVPRTKERTLYDRTGNLVAWVALSILGLVSLIAIGRSKLSETPGA